MLLSQVQQGDETWNAHLITKFLFIYNQGYLAGKDRGRRDCQYDIRMALGIKSDGSTM